MEIVQRNSYTLEVNGKLIVKSLDRNEWLSDEHLTIEEHQALMAFLIRKLENKPIKSEKQL